MTLILGVDEAGRGPIIGPLIIVGTLIKESDLPKLEKLNIKDSKLLTRRKIDPLAKKLKSLLKYKILVIQSKEIDAALNSDSLNLNWLEARKTIELINYFNPDRVIVDSPSPNLRAYKNYIYELLKNKKVELIVEHKADSKYLIVSAASILAKSLREKEMDKIKRKYGDCGPGYMSNLITQKFLKDNFEKHPEIFRKSWIPYKKLVNGRKQKKLDDFRNHKI